jgi:hypothetical protein
MQSKIRFLIRRTKTSKKSGRREYYYWSPPKDVCKKFGLQSKPLATSVPADAPSQVRYEAAAREAAQLNAHYDALRAITPAIDPAKIENTLPWLISAFRSSPEWLGTEASTRKRTYEYAFRVLTEWSASKGHPSVTLIQKRHCKRLHISLCKIDPISEKMQLTSAKNIMAAFRRLLNFGMELIDELKFNPAAAINIKSPKDRLTIWTEREILTFEAKAKELGRPSLGHAVRFASELAQRRADVLALDFSQYSNPTIDQRSGAFRMKQQKTGAIICVPVSKRLGPTLRSINRNIGSVIINETTGEPYLGDTFAHDFRKVADAADLHHLLFLDLRRTGVVNLARAGCTIAEIAAISGHDLDDTKRILEKYLPRDAIMARHAVNKVDAYRENNPEMDEEEVETTSSKKLKPRRNRKHQQ